MKSHKMLCIAAAICAVTLVGTSCSAAPDTSIVGDQYQKITGLVKPGDTHVGSITIDNSSEEEKFVDITVAPFSYAPDRDGAFLQNYTNNTTRTELSKWIKVAGETTRSLPPKQRTKIDYSFTIPRGTVSGSQAAIILLQTVKDPDGTDSTGVLAEARSGFPIYINVDGVDIVESGTTDWKVNSFLFAPPIIANATAENIGNVSFQANFTLSIRNAFGDELAFEDKQAYEILPETKLSANHKWSEAPQLGFFNVTETITYLDQTKEYSSLVIIIPLWFILIVLTMLTLAIVAIIRRAKTRNRVKSSSLTV